jgi:hypothetical protein
MTAAEFHSSGFRERGVTSREFLVQSCPDTACISGALLMFANCSFLWFSSENRRKQERLEREPRPGARLHPARSFLLLTHE